MKKFSKILENINNQKYFEILATINLIVEASSEGEAGYLGDSILGGIEEQSDFTIQNIVVSGDTTFPIRLEGLAEEHEKYSSYEPELFPGLIYRMESPKTVSLIFVSGRLIITGAKNRKSILDSATKLYPVLFKYKSTPSGISNLQ